jgi:serine/threonine protein kinase
MIVFGTCTSDTIHFIILILASRSHYWWSRDGCHGHCASSLTQQGLKDVCHALDLLHRAGYVFGDLRLANILNLQDGHATLVDFDWSGPVEKVFYPMGLNKEIEWPVTCDAGTPIRKDDDLFMFGNL